MDRDIRVADGQVLPILFHKSQFLGKRDDGRVSLGYDIPVHAAHGTVERGRLIRIGLDERTEGGQGVKDEVIVRLQLEFFDGDLLGKGLLLLIPVGQIGGEEQRGEEIGDQDIAQEHIPGHPTDFREQAGICQGNKARYEHDANEQKDVLRDQRGEGIPDYPKGFDDQLANGKRCFHENHHFHNGAEEFAQERAPSLGLPRFRCADALDVPENYIEQDSREQGEQMPLHRHSRSGSVG